MLIRHAEEILDMASQWKDESCTCFISSPCSKCIRMPNDEDIKEARATLKKWGFDC